MLVSAPAAAERAHELVVEPGLEEARALARDHTVVPLRHAFIDDCETPVAAYLKLRGEEPSFLLESAEQGQRFGRWSFVGVRPRTTVRLDRGVLTVGGEPRRYADPYLAVAEELARYRPAPLCGGGPPFAGGAVGLFGYDLVRHAEPSVGAPNPDELDLPDLALMVSDVLLAFDHFTHEVTVIANVFAEDADTEGFEPAYAAAAAAIAEVR
ncbi:MAG: anthranilate synthase component I, partial [Thermoleophilaceae bacterium]|nr:anthranilate synthase component I [Thermoleophilaceae bacterium]